MPDLTIEISQPNAEALARFTPQRILGLVGLALVRALPHVHAAITRERFTGKGPFPVPEHRLGVRSGNLRRQIYWTRPVYTEDSVTATIGTPVSYAGVHEFGFSGSVKVREHQRVRLFSDKGRRLTRAGAERKALRGESVTGFASTVKAHTRTVNIPARAPLRTGLAEHLGPQFNEALTRELRNA